MVHRLDKLTKRGPKLCDDILTVYTFIGVLNVIVAVEIFYMVLLVKKCICRSKGQPKVSSSSNFIRAM